MKLNFWFAVVLAVAGAWYAFAISGPRQVFVEVLPEELADAMHDVAAQAHEAGQNGVALEQAQVEAIVREWSVEHYGAPYNVRVHNFDGYWMVTAMPKEARRDVTTIWDRVFLLRTRVEYWPMFKVSQQVPEVVTDSGPSLAQSIAMLETSTIRVERRIIRADALRAATIAMRTAR